MSNEVSIHAPARGATQIKILHPNLYQVSIHAPARGATNMPDCLYKHTEFQSTHPHGVRHFNDDYSREDYGFNPRTRTGCDFL